jgi:hypothetical protein
MSVEAKDVLALLPSAFEGAKMLASLVSMRAAEGVSLGQDITAFIIDAEARGLSETAIIQGVNDLVVQLDKRFKFGA